MKRRPIITKEALEHLYLTEHFTLEEIGQIYGGFTRSRIHQLIKKFKIDTTYAEKFPVTCPQCGISFITTRQRHRESALRYCSPDCYQIHRKIRSQYKPSRQGQRIARRIMEINLGRTLLPSEVIHHIDGDCDNNHISNLIVFPSQSDHLKHHHEMRINSLPG